MNYVGTAEKKNRASRDYIRNLNLKEKYLLFRIRSIISPVENVLSGSSILISIDPISIDILDRFFIDPKGF